MWRLGHFAVVNEDRDFEGDNGGVTDVDSEMSEDSTSTESSDSDDSDSDSDSDSISTSDLISDRESCANWSPIAGPTKIHPQTGVDRVVRSNEGKVHPENFVFEYPIDVPNNLQPKAGADGLIRLNEDEKIHEVICRYFFKGMERIGVNAQIEHIGRNPFNANAIAIARVQTFNIYAKAVKHGENQTKMRFVWFGASKEEIQKIISHGFSHEYIEKDGAFGHGLYLCTNNSFVECVQSSTVDDRGIKRLLLCRVLRGRTEVVKPGSSQWHPSSDEFHYGVDKLEHPKKLIIWSTQLNTHVLPEFVISFKILAGSNGAKIERIQLDEPLTRPCMPIKALVSALSKILPPEATKKIDEYHRKYIERKISRRDMFLGFRGLAGDRLLLMVVKDFAEQQDLKQAKAMNSKIADRLLIK